MAKITYYSIIILFFIPLISCVSNKKYNEMVILKDHYKEEANKIYTLEAEKASVAAEKKQLQERLGRAENQINTISIELLNTTNEKDSLNSEHLKLLDSYDNLKKSSSSNSAELQDKLSSVENTLKRRNVEVERLRFLLKDHEGNVDSVLESFTQAEIDIQKLYKWSKNGRSALNTFEKDIQSVLERYPHEMLYGKRDSSQMRLSFALKFVYETSEENISRKVKNILSAIAKNARKHANLQVRVVAYGSANSSSSEKWTKSAEKAAIIANLLNTYGLSSSNLSAESKAFIPDHAVVPGIDPELARERVEVLVSPSIEYLIRNL